MFLDLLLVSPISRYEPPAYLPYGLLCIAAFLREHGYEVGIYDRNADKTDLTEVLKRYRPKAVGVSCLSGPVIKDGIDISKEIKRESPDTFVIWGGLHPTLFPAQVLKEEYIDFVVMGEGEKTALELMQKIRKPQEYKNIKGLAYKEKGKIKINGPREFIKNLDELPFPAWDLVNIKKYFQKKFYANKVLTLMTSRGCPYGCTFCYNQTVNQRRWRGHSAQKMVEEIEYLKSRYNIDGIFFFEDNFDAKRSRIDEFCKKLIQSKINLRWQHLSRVNYAHLDRLKLEKEAGCMYIEYGVESGSQRILDFIKKEQNIDQIIQAFENCQKVGIRTNALFMIGLPTETKEDVDATVRLLESLPAHFSVCAIYKPYPGTELYNYCLKHKNLKIPETLEKSAQAFSCGSTEMNMSEISSAHLQKIQRIIGAKNVINEIKSCIRYRNFKLLFEELIANLHFSKVRAALTDIIARIIYKIGMR